MKKVMTKKLTRLGNSAALVIDKPILELLGIGPETFLEIRTDGANLILTPLELHAPTDAELDASVKRVMRKYGRAFRLLGDASSSIRRKKSSGSPPA